MTQPVATKENIIAISNPTHNQNPHWQGKWAPESIKIKNYDYFTLNGKPIAYEAECTFTFTGTDPTKNGASVTDQETITLTAKETTLQLSVLCNGDEKTGKEGNKLRVEGNNHLTTD
ncbi:MAG: hypothetical protein V4471_03315 [Pseudomonadota bacterium]